MPGMSWKREKLRILFFAIFIAFVVLYALLVSNRSTKRALFGLDFNSATYLLVSSDKIELPNIQIEAGYPIYIDIDCDGPWRVTRFPSWLEINSSDQYGEKGIIKGNVICSSPQSLFCAA